MLSIYLGKEYKKRENMLLTFICGWTFKKSRFQPLIHRLRESCKLFIVSRLSCFFLYINDGLRTWFISGISVLRDYGAQFSISAFLHELIFHRSAFVENRRYMPTPAFRLLGGVRRCKCFNKADTKVKYIKKSKKSILSEN
jgi:hypothetical protein